MERTHAELEQYHYHQIRTDPYYAAQGLLEVRLEEEAINISSPFKGEDITDFEDRISNLEVILMTPGQIPRQYEDKLKQIQGELVYLRNKVNELTTKRKLIGTDFL